MPRQRIQHGKIYVTEPDIEATDVVDDHGKPTGVKAHAATEYIPGSATPEGATVQEMPSLDVTWRGENGWVQIGIEAPSDWWDRFEESRKSAEQSHFGVYTEVLTRDEINDMIRTLRRARNAVYGSDE